MKELLLKQQNIGIYNDGPLNNDKLSGTIIENMNNSNDSSSGKYEDNKNNVDKIDFKELIDKNNGMLSTIVSRFYTTQEALSYTFRAK